MILGYYPFGLKHKGYNNVTSANVNSVASKFKYNGVELEESLGLDLYEMDVRSYDPAIGRFTGNDPVVHHDFSPYQAFDNNPVFWSDPSGADSGVTGFGSALSPDWISKLNEDGSTSYIAEAGDSASTMSSQYGISQDNAEAITGTTGTTEIAEGTEVSGQTVNNVTGSEVLKLDLNSKEGRSSQKRFDQFVYATDHSGSRGSSASLSTDYYSNTQFKDVISGEASLNIDGVNVTVNYNIPLYRSATFDGTSTAVALANQPFTIRQRGGSYFGANQDNVRSAAFTSQNKRIGNYDISVQRSNSNRLYNRLNKTFPQYNYVRFPENIKD